MCQNKVLHHQSLLIVIQQVVLQIKERKRKTKIEGGKAHHTQGEAIAEGTVEAKAKLKNEEEKGVSR